MSTVKVDISPQRQRIAHAITWLLARGCEAGPNLNIQVSLDMDRVRHSQVMTKLAIWFEAVDVAKECMNKANILYQHDVKMRMNKKDGNIGDGDGDNNGDDDGDRVVLASFVASVLLAASTAEQSDWNSALKDLKKLETRLAAMQAMKPIQLKSTREHLHATLPNVCCAAFNKLATVEPTDGGAASPGALTAKKGREFLQNLKYACNLMVQSMASFNNKIMVELRAYVVELRKSVVLLCPSSSSDTPELPEPSAPDATTCCNNCMETKMEGLRNMLETTTLRLDGDVAAARAMAAAAEQMSDSSDAHIKTIEQRLKTLEKRTATAEKRAEEAKKRAEAAEKRAEVAEKRAEEAEKRAEEVKKRMEGAEKCAEEAKKRAEAAEKRADAVEKCAETLTEHVAAVNERATVGEALTNVLKQAARQLDAAEMRAVSADCAAQSAQDASQSAQVAVKELETKYLTTHEAVETLTELVDKLRSDVHAAHKMSDDASSGELETKLATLEEALEKNEAKLANLGDQVYAMYAGTWNTAQWMHMAKMGIKQPGA
jgi:hypothetical protein